MDRAIFCPKIEMLEEAEKLASTMLLPIIVGDNFHTSRISFDRSAVSAITIPMEKYVEILRESLPLGMHQRIVCRDEFTEIKNRISASVNGESVSPMIREVHTVKWIYETKQSGEHLIELFLDGEKTCEETFYVY